jgi:hypothetical protein
MPADRQTGDRALEKYGDLITNGLDLLSFLLVTPEIVRVIAPAASWLMGWMVAVGVTLPVAALAWWRLIGADWREFTAPAPWVTVVVCVGVIAIVVPLWHRMGIWKAYGKVARDIRAIASKHFLALGILLFFVSRLIAFYGSAVKAGLLV